MAGQVIFTDHADNTVIPLAASLTQFLADFAGDLEGGKYSLNKEALHYYQPKWSNDALMAKYDNGGGNHIFVFFRGDDTIIKGFDHESPVKSVRKGRVLCLARNLCGRSRRTEFPS